MKLEGDDAVAQTVGTPSNLELQMLSVLWDKGPSTARDALDAMPDGKPRAYTTVLSVLQGMERKGLVKRRRVGQAHVYRAAVTRKQTLRPLLRNLVQNVFGGSPSSAMQHLLSETRVDEEEMNEIRRLLDERGKKSKRGGK